MAQSKMNLILMLLYLEIVSPHTILSAIEKNGYRHE
jgi:hypothetical protein